MTPGLAEVKLAANLAGVSLHPFENGVNHTNAITVDPGSANTYSGIANIFRDGSAAAYEGAGGAVGLARANDLITRLSFAGKSLSKQAQLTSEAAQLGNLAKVASAASGIANVMNYVSFGSDAWTCIHK